MTARPIFHIAIASEWEQTQGSGWYAPATFHEEGFVHCSYAWQLERVATTVFGGKRGLVLLRIDPIRLSADVREERAKPDAPSDAPMFPHVYGPIDVDAVTGFWPFEADPDGLFRMPAEAIAEM
jgi:uncharacterized protein (DUF952 family)